MTCLHHYLTHLSRYLRTLHPRAHVSVSGAGLRMSREARG